MGLEIKPFLLKFTFNRGRSRGRRAIVERL